MIGGQEAREQRDAEHGYPVKPYIAAGWIYSDDIKVNKYTNWPGKGYFVPMEDLRSMDELLPIRLSNLGIK